MKKFISVVLVLSLLLSCASAAGVYEVEADTQVELDSTIWWPSDYKISTLDLTPSESTTLTWIYDQLVDIWNDMRAGFTFVDDDIVVGNTLLSNLYTLLDGSDSTLSYILQGVGMTNGYLNVTNTKLADLIGTVGIGNGTLGRLETLSTSSSSYLRYIRESFVSYAGNSVLDAAGNIVSLSADTLFSTVFRWGVMGLSSDLKSVEDVANGIWNDLYLGSGVYYLEANGVLRQAPGNIALKQVIRTGLAGLSANLVGSETDNVYQGTSINNENKTSTFSATGLGPMLNTWLGDIQNDLGLLSFVFASPQDLELKAESADNMTAIGDSLLSSDSKSSVKVKDITDISAASDSIQAFGNTGVTPGQAFAQLGDANLFRFFSAETAADLDTTTSTYSRDPKTQIVTNYYEESRSEFYKIIAGEGNDG